MANHLRKEAPSARIGRTPPKQPDYSDEVTEQHLEAIRQFLDADGSKAAKRKPLYAPAW